MHFLRWIAPGLLPCILSKGAIVMRPSTKDTAVGKFHEIKGKVRAKAGQLTNNSGLQIKGTMEEAAGKVQGIIGQAEKALEKRRPRQ
jgi:uncharacterized protein YjbJ (UPF0337 family)